MGSYPGKQPTLCWDCTKAGANGCSWHRRFEPVKGWTAAFAPINVYRNRKTYAAESYVVEQCPEFEFGRLPRMIKQKIGLYG